MMALAGFAYSALVCSSFSRAQKRVIEMGFSDDINTYVMISGTGARDPLANFLASISITFSPHKPG